MNALNLNLYSVKVATAAPKVDRGPRIDSSNDAGPNHDGKDPVSGLSLAAQRSRWHLVSAVLFTLSSVLYLAMAILVVPGYWFYRGVPSDVMAADDDATWWNYFVNGTDDGSLSAADATTNTADDDSAWWNFHRDDGFVPQEVATADDDATWEEWYDTSAFYHDDTLFAFDPVNAPERSAVTTYMLLYVLAALGFVITGGIERNLAETSRARALYGLMTVAATFGLVSAVLTNYSPTGSNVTNLISTNLWCLEAAYIVVMRLRGEWKADAYHKSDRICRLAISKWFWVADVAFLVGTAGDAITSWIYVFGLDNLDLAFSQIGCAAMWLVCALVYLAVAVYDHNGCGSDEKDDDDEEDDDESEEGEEDAVDRYIKSGSLKVPPKEAFDVI